MAGEFDNFVERCNWLYPKYIGMQLVLSEVSAGCSVTATVPPQSRKVRLPSAVSTPENCLDHATGRLVLLDRIY